MRVISGQFKGRKLRTLKGLALRPTSDRLKETLFNIIAPRIYGARFLDCFGGSGSIGIEALSRGAERVWFVENNSAAARLIQENLSSLGAAERCELCTIDVPSALKQFKRRNLTFDLIFLDPPYRSTEYETMIEGIWQAQVLSSNGIMIVEHEKKRSLAESVGVLNRYRLVVQGDSCLSFYSHDL